MVPNRRRRILPRAHAQLLEWIKTHLHRGDVIDVYDVWPQPDVIVSDGAYGVGGFPGDPRTPDTLVDWYRPHAAAWSRRSHPATSLWFWNTEIGWALVHPLLVENGWEYVQAIVWDKGKAHIAGNVNGDTIRQFPVVTELCVLYRRRLTLPIPGGRWLPAKEWLRYEWQRAGLPLYRANEACGVKNAATRKYLTLDWHWYFPPPDAMAKLVEYANRHGQADGRPYFSLDGIKPVTTEEWARLRSPWTHQHGLTNVWSHPPVSGAERVRGNGRRLAPRVHRPTTQAALHLNQKPLIFMERVIRASSNPGAVVWEPFGGLCTGSVAAIHLNRTPYAAECVPDFYDQAVVRLVTALQRVKQAPLGGSNISSQDQIVTLQKDAEAQALI